MQHKVGREWVPDGPRVARMDGGCDFSGPRRGPIPDWRGWGYGSHTKGEHAASWRDTTQRTFLTRCR